MKRINRQASCTLASRLVVFGALVVDKRGIVGGSRWLRQQGASPALEAAERLTNPRPGFPASGPADGVAEGDPRMQWREYWSSEHQMPYYHHVLSDAVTWDIPDGFVTRFPTYHAQNSSLIVTSEGRVVRATSATEGTTAAPSEKETSSGKPLTLKKKLALYGSGGFILYLIIHNICLFCVFTSIYFLGFDLVGLARSYGFNIKRSGSANDTAGTPQQKSTFFGTFITAVLLNKLTVPVQLMLTLLLAPRFVPLLQPLANRLVPKIKSWFPFLPISGHASKPAAAAAAAAGASSTQA